MPIQQYIDQIKKRYRTGISREHSYRGDLQNLLQELAPGILVTNEPARVECGAPDYSITRKITKTSPGYQPAQKWLKDRKGRQLSVDDIMHYQKIIVALTETHRLMQEVDGVGV